MPKDQSSGKKLADMLYGQQPFDVPTPENLRLNQQMIEREMQAKAARDAALTPLDKAKAAYEAAKLLGSGVVATVGSIPTHFVYGPEAADQYIAKRISIPETEKGMDYAQNVADFLEQLETKYKIPPLMPESIALQYVTGPAVKQAVKATKQKAAQPQGALQKADGGTVKGQDASKPAFGVYPMIGRRREDRQDREAAKTVPIDVARGFAAGALGMPGDIESLVRMLPGFQEETILPTSEDILKRIPLGSDTPASRAAAGLGTLAGGFYTGPGSAARLVTGIPKAVVQAGKDFALAAGQPAVNVIKQLRGNWLPGSVERAVAPLKSSIAPPDARLQAIIDSPESTPSMREGAQNLLSGFSDESSKASALNNWVDRNLTNYIKKEMGTPEDPVRKLAEQGISHLPADAPMSRYMDDVWARREKGGFPAAQGISRQAQVWESIADEAIRPKQIGETIRSNNPGGMTMREMIASDPGGEWANKAPDTQMVYELRRPGTSSTQEIPSGLGFNHILDVLREDLATGRLRPEQLSKVSMEQAVRRTAEYDKELAEKMAKATAAAREGLPVYKEYPQGYRWVELNKPGAFSAESDAMGHSVRGYEPPKGHPDWDPKSGESGSESYGQGGWEAIKSGRAKVYSLVDPKGNPHVTVEVGRPQPRSEPEEMQAIYDQAAAEANAKNLQSRDEWHQFYFPRVTELQDAMLTEKSKALPPRITQIKGKRNEAPKEEYLPFVQDFVRSGQWSDVRDLKNTGFDYPAVGNSGIFDVDQAQKLKQAGFDVPNYLTRDEADTLKDALYRLETGKDPVTGLPVEGKAQGGTVHFSDNPDTMRLELAGGGLVKGLKAAVKASKGEAAAAKEAPSVIIPGKVNRVEEAVRQSKGDYGAKRVQRAADEIKNLEKMYQEKGLLTAFTGDNAQAVVTMSPADFERYAEQLKGRTSADIGPKMAELARQGEIDKYTVPTDEYIQHLQRLRGGFEDVPFLGINKDEYGLPIVPFISGHEGRHRSRALAASGEPTSLIRLVPRAELREPFPRRTQEEYIEALRKELEMTDNMIIPEGDPRPAIKLPDIYADGGAVRMQAGGLARLLGSGAKAAKAAKDEVKPNLVIKSKPGIIVSDLIDEDPEIAKRMGALARAKRQADIAAEGKRQEAAKKVEPSVGYRPSTPLNPDPLVGTRFVNEAPFGLNPNEPFDISKFKGGSGLVLPWDSQSRNVRTTQVSGMDLPNQIFRQTHGGVPYSFDTQHAAKGVVGASGEDIAKRVKTRADTAVRENIARGGTGELLHFPITMGARAEDYALPYSEFSFDIINHKLMTGELTKADADKLTDMVRNFEPPKYKGKKPFADFAGFTSPEGLNQIYTGQGLKVPSGELRKAIADRIIWQKGSQEKLGFNAEDLMNATTYEPLRGVDKGFIGSSVMRNSPTGMRLTPSAGKYPYDTDFSGEHLGRLADNVDVESVFYRTLNPIKRELMQRETKKPYTRESLRNAAIGAIEKRNENVSQILDQQFLDDLDTYFTELKKPTEYKKGGAVRKAVGGDITAEDLTIEERPL